MFKTLIKQAVKDTHAQANHAMIELATQMEHHHLQADEIKLLEDRIEEATESKKATWHCLLGLMYLYGVGITQNLALALEQLNIAIEKEPKYATAYRYRGATHYLFCDYQAALNDYNQAIQLNDDEASFYFVRAATHKRLGNSTAYFNDLDKTIEKNPEHVDAYYERAVNHQLENIASGKRFANDDILEDYATVIKLTNGHHPEIRKIIGIFRDAPTYKGRLYLGVFCEKGLIDNKGRTEALHHYKQAIAKALSTKQTAVFNDISLIAEKNKWSESWPEGQAYLSKWTGEFRNKH